MDPEQIAAFLDTGEWSTPFDAGALAAGRKLARARLVAGVKAERLDTGDTEIKAAVSERDGSAFHPELILWAEGESLQMETECACDHGTNCPHAVAVIEHLLKATEARLGAAFGEAPQAEKMLGKVLGDQETGGREQESGESLKLEPEENQQPTTNNQSLPPAPRFLLRLERRPQGDRLAWLPEILGQAFAVYGKHQVPLDPGGNLKPLTTGAGEVKRERGAEMQALQTLYALDLRPGAEEPPASLKKVERPSFEGTLWTVDAKAWPHPEFFWQRFRHEGCPALERRGWEIQFAPDVGMVPLVFKTETWKAEIVEEGKGWFHLSAGFEIEGEQFALQPILASLVANNFLECTEGMPGGQEFLIFLPDGRGLALPVGRFRRILTVLGQLLDFPFPEGDIRLSKLDAALLAGEDEEEECFGVETSPEIEALASRLADFEQIERMPLPKGLKATLRDYQLDGFHWMQFLARYGLHGILADDMGLGKTLQGLCHLLAEKESGRDGGRPSLVMAPTSVVMSWQREAAKFAPDLKVLVLQGPDRRRRFREIPAADLVLTSYALLPRDLEEITRHRFHIFALDEAQHIKNPGAQVSRAVREVDAEHRLCLSGTPVENSLADLWSLMDFLMPGLLGTLEAFNTTYRTPIEKDGDAEKAAQLARRVGPLILRRTKHDVAKELPPKTEILHTIELEGTQQDLYETVRSTMDKQVRQALAIRGTEAQIVFLDALLKLRQICCHPALLKGSVGPPEGSDGPPGPQEGSDGPPGHHEGAPATAFPAAAPVQGDRPATSSKFEYFVDLLSTLRAEKHRVLVFSQFTSMLAIAEAHLQEVGSPYLILTGATKDRQDLVERWQGGEGEVFLISLKAGGTGLTLTGADTVIHYDPWWNPAAENQATDRAYRIGQDKPVFVHKLLCKDTVEERIQQMQGKKDDLATDLLTGALQGLSLTPETMAELLG